ncbi:MAG TPA: oxygen-independent coproporphyrinogen III oxidase [Woeseiaceae bacterium]|nr:oxygen-independent coproporphyrinogen III oxidase [Woeseiaceae bacterium]
MSRAPIFDPDLVRRYDGPGPRYTSYPTAPHFRESFGGREFRRHAALGNQASPARPISLYVHVPWCFSPCFYCGCNRLITRDPAKGERYVERLLAEIDLVAPLFDRDRDVLQLHFGGGTPNFLPPAQIGAMLERLAGRFNLSGVPARDFSIELDPRHVAEGDIAALARLGFNRASLGVQDFDPAVQRAVNRVQSVEQTAAVIEDCRRAGFRSVNVDLIYGLPLQTPGHFERTLETVIALRPDRLAVYGYAHLPELFKAQRQIRAEQLPDAGTRLRLLGLAVERFTDAGYRYIGLDHFALPEDDLAAAASQGGLQRNFMGYTTHAHCDLIGLGVSAISHIADSYSQNRRDLTGWEIDIDQGRLPAWRGLSMSADDVLRAEVIETLMCRGEIDTNAVESRHAIAFDVYFEGSLRRLTPLVGDGLVTIDRTRIRATERGRFLLRVIAMCFDAYLHAAERLHAAEGERPRYSKAM